MIFDYCCGIGSFPFRRVPDAAPEALLRLMDAHGIECALVSAFEGILYRNVQTANESLAERVASRRDRLLPAAIVNPAYARAVEDAELCVSEMGMRAIRLMPGFHGYSLDDPCVRPALEAAARLDVPVSVVMRVEDERQRHWLIRTDVPSADALARLVRGFPGLSFVLERATTREALALAAAAPEQRNWLCEISGRGLWLRSQTKGEPDVLGLLGPGRLLFGSDAPLQYIEPAFAKLAETGLFGEALDKVRYGNAARLLKLDGSRAIAR